MQEQTKYNITSEQGWTAMQDILDREMPVRRRSRRLILFWWSSAAVTLALICYQLSAVSFLPLTVGHRQEEVNKPAALGDDQPSVESRPSSAGETSDDFSTIRYAPTSPGLSSRNLIPPVPGERDRLAAGIAHTPGATSSGDNGTSDGFSTTGFTPASHVTNLIPPVHGEHDRLAAGTTHTTDATSSGESVTSDGFSTIGVAPISQLPIVNRQLSIPMIRPDRVEPRKPSPKKIHPHLAIAGLAGFNSGIGGYAGAGADIRISRKLSLSAGTGYRSFHPGASIFPGHKDEAFSNTPATGGVLSPDLAAYGIDNYIPAEVLYSGAGHEALISLVDHIRQWQLSGGAQWNIFRRFFVSAGLHFAFINKVISRYPVIAGYPASLDAYNSAEHNNSFNQFNLARNTMTSTYAGIGMVLGHVDLTVQWTHGLSPYLPGNRQAATQSKGRKDFIRGVSAGIKYTL